MTSETFEEALRDLLAENPELASDFDFHAIAELFRAKPAATEKVQRQMAVLRAELLNDLELMVEIKSPGLIDPKP